MWVPGAPPAGVGTPTAPTQPEPRARGLGFNPWLRRHRLATCLSRETPPPKESLARRRGGAQAAGKRGCGASRLWCADSPLALLPAGPPPRRHNDRGCSRRPGPWGSLAPGRLIWTRRSRGTGLLLISPQLLGRRVQYTHKITSLYGRPESPPCRWHLDHKPVWFQYKIQKCSYGCI